MASINTSADTLAAMKATFRHVTLCFIPPHSTSYLQPCDLAVFRSSKSCIQAQASTTLVRSFLDRSFDDVVMNKAWRRQSPPEWAVRAVTDLFGKNQAWTTGWRTLRAHSDDDFREDCCEGRRAARRWRLVRETEIEPEPSPEDPVEWVMAEALDDEDDVPMPDATGPLEADRHASCSGIRTSDVQLGAVHRTASGIRHWTGFASSQRLSVV